MFWTTTSLSMSNQQIPIVHTRIAGLAAMQELRLFHVDEAHYLAEPIGESLRIPGIDNQAEELLLMTVVATPPALDQGNEWLNHLVSHWMQLDDVLQPEFLSTVLLVQEEGQPNANLEELHGYMQREWGTSKVYTASVKSLGDVPRYGPLVRWKGQFCTPYRLYDDPNLAFTVGVKPRQTNSGFENLRLGGEYYSALSLAVPSRISHRPDTHKPLAGFRFAVKDIFDIEGMRVTAGCRAFFDLSRPSTKTAPALQRLITQGAHLVGSLKLGSLITKEEPTESVDYHAPFNPRADGYQSAWSSSGGSGAATAAYDWLDFTVATDTTGSSRRPAMANGIFQHRITQGAVSLDGILPSFKKFDSPAVYTRNLLELETVVKTWIGVEKSEPQDLPISFVYPKDFWPIENQEQMNLVDTFIADFQKVYGVTVKEISIADEWNRNPPQSADPSVERYLDNVGIESFCYGVYHELDWFRDEYHAKFGRNPYVNPTMQWRWDAALNVTEEQHVKANNKLDVYRDWLLERIMQSGKTNTIVILPITSQDVDYRDVPPPPPGPPAAFDGIWLAPIMGAPEVTVPIGEAAYESRISGKKEYLPVVVSLLGSPGSDVTLLAILRKMLEESERPTSVRTGSRMFS